MHHVTSCKATYVRCMQGLAVTCCVENCWRSKCPKLCGELLEKQVPKAVWELLEKQGPKAVCCEMEWAVRLNDKAATVVNN